MALFVAVEVFERPLGTSPGCRCTSARRCWNRSPPSASSSDPPPGKG